MFVGILTCLVLSLITIVSVLMLAITLALNVVYELAPAYDSVYVVDDASSSGASRTVG